MDPQDADMEDAGETDQQFDEGMGARHCRAYEGQTSKYFGRAG